MRKASGEEEEEEKVPLEAKLRKEGRSERILERPGRIWVEMLEEERLEWVKSNCWAFRGEGGKRAEATAGAEARAEVQIWASSREWGLGLVLVACGEGGRVVNVMLEVFGKMEVLDEDMIG